MLDERAGAAAVVAAEERPHRKLERLLLARRDPKGETGRRGLAPLEQTANDKASWIFPFTASTLFDSFGLRRWSRYGVV